MGKMTRDELIDALSEKEVELAADNGDAYEALKEIYINGDPGYEQMPDDELIAEAINQGVLSDESEFKRTPIRAGGKSFLRDEAIRRLVNHHVDQARHEGLEPFLARLLREGHPGFEKLPEAELSALLEQTVP